MKIWNLVFFMSLIGASAVLADDQENKAELGAFGGSQGAGVTYGLAVQKKIPIKYGTDGIWNEQGQSLGAVFEPGIKADGRLNLKPEQGEVGVDDIHVDAPIFTAVELNLPEAVPLRRFRGFSIDASYHKNDAVKFKQLGFGMNLLSFGIALPLWNKAELCANVELFKWIVGQGEVYPHDDQKRSESRDDMHGIFRAGVLDAGICQKIGQKDMRIKVGVKSEVAGLLRDADHLVGLYSDVEKYSRTRVGIDVDHIAGSPVGASISWTQLKTIPSEELANSVSQPVDGVHPDSSRHILRDGYVGVGIRGVF